MTWLNRHRDSEQYAAAAEVAKRDGNLADAQRLYREAAQAESAALRLIQPEKARTLGVTAISAASLYFKANELDQAEDVALWSLVQQNIPSFAKDELRTIVQTIWNERIFRNSGVEFVQGELLVSVAGGLVATGAAPLELVHRKVDEVKNLFFRAVEMLAGLPVRLHGLPTQLVRDNFRPWIVQAPAGSYQFALRVEKPRQIDLFPQASPELAVVTNTLLRIMEISTSTSLEQIDKVVPDEGYRDCFLKQVRNLAPSGKSFERLTIRSATAIDAVPIIISPQSRKVLSASLKERSKKIDQEPSLIPAQVIGVLRALDLDRDWLEIVEDKTGNTIRIYQTGDVIDDLIGPMVNHRVIADVAIKSDGKKIFRDIQSEE